MALTTRQKTALIEAGAALGGFFLIRHTLRFLEFYPWGTVVGAANIAILAVVFGFMFLHLKTGRPLSGIGLKLMESRVRFLLVFLGTFLAVALAANLLGDTFRDVFPPKTYNRFYELEGDFIGFLVATVFIAWLSAAFGEEVLFRGILLTRLAVVFGKGKGAWIFAGLLQAVIFGLLHANQGWAVAAMASVLAVLFALSFWAARGSLWPAIFVHAIPDTISLYGHYTGGG